ncbi:transcriptional regulator [Ectopseudomonas mendocina]|jgi:prophage regulatory protein|uniref:helix-turn-helix transcriptional regulator n=1 Tax=Ectopseudomonas mendocina TaxID=300 RepID=UPI001ADF05E0|nr:transcriptional regulator [Pseudomonas mendocina]QTN45045.1 transcriptional regulator [Pseudomonas mendocina]
MNTNSTAVSELWTKSETASFMGRTTSGLDKLCARDPSFPKPMKDGNNRRSRVYFVRSEIEAYIAAKLASRAEAAA